MSLDITASKLITANIFWSSEKACFMPIVGRQTPITGHRLMEYVHHQFGEYSDKVLDAIRDLSPEALELYREEQRQGALANLELPVVYHDESEFVQAILEDGAVQVSAAGQATFRTSLDEIKGSLEQYNIEVGKIPKDDRKATGLRPLRMDVMSVLLNAAIANEARKALDALKKRVRFVPSRKQDAEKNIDTLCDVFHDTVDQSSMRSPRWILDKIAFCHMIWQVKRKLFGLPVKEHMVLSLYGGQGSGKTELIKSLAQPLADVYSPLQPYQLFDRFSHSIISKFYIGHLEEFPGTEDSKELSKFKAIISNSTMAMRKIQQQAVETVPQNLTFFATTNVRVRDLIYDPTGMRRFWEIDLTWLSEMDPERVTDGRPHLDFDTINSIDWRAIWEGIDENNDSAPILRSTEVYQSIYREQLRQRRMNPVEHCLVEMGMMTGKCKGGKHYKVDAGAFYECFKEYCEAANIPSISRHRYHTYLERVPGLKVRMDRSTGMPKALVVHRPADGYPGSFKLLEQDAKAGEDLL